MATSRASSLPPLTGGNPFWSEEANFQLRLATARPQDLPVPSDDELEQPLERGRARSRPLLEVDGEVDGGAEAGVRTSESRTSFTTALRTPTSWITAKKEQPMQSQGMKSEGPVPQGDGSGSLEQELGNVMYEHLLDENELLKKEIAELKRQEEVRSESQRLKEEIEGLKRKLENQEIKSVNSWSEVGVEGSQSSQPPPKTPRVGRQGKDSDETRFTPGGTQIPTGLPPEDSPRPPLPAWPPWLSPVEEYKRAKQEQEGMA